MRAPSSPARFYFSLSPASLRHKKSRSVETKERYRLLENKENGKSKTVHGLGTWLGPLIIAVAALSSNNLQTLIKNTLKAWLFWSLWYRHLIFK